MKGREAQEELVPEDSDVNRREFCALVRVWTTGRKWGRDMEGRVCGDGGGGGGLHTLRNILRCIPQRRTFSAEA